MNSALATRFIKEGMPPEILSAFAKTTEHTTTFVLMSGPPGAGKTTIAHHLGRELHWPVLDRDSLFSRLLLSEIPPDKASRISYLQLIDLGRDFLRQGLSVILDSPIGYEFVLEHARNIAQQEAANLKVIYCFAEAHIRNPRLAARPVRPSQSVVDTRSDAETLSKFRHIPAEALTLYTARPIEQLILEALLYLRF